MPGLNMRAMMIALVKEVKRTNLLLGKCFLSNLAVSQGIPFGQLIYYLHNQEIVRKFLVIYLMIQSKDFPFLFIHDLFRKRMKTQHL